MSDPRDWIRIVSDGTVVGTKVLGSDGLPLAGVIRIDILPIDSSGGFIEATVTFMAALDITVLDPSRRSDG